MALLSRGLGLVSGLVARGLGQDAIAGRVFRIDLRNWALKSTFEHMADTGSEQKLRVFIFYSRRDSSDFADELVAGLELAAGRNRFCCEAMSLRPHKCGRSSGNRRRVTIRAIGTLGAVDTR